MLDRARKNPLPPAEAGTWAAVEQGMAGTWAAVEQGIDVILDETERMVDAVIERVVRAKALRPVVRSALRSDLVSWPTPWVRPRAIDTEANDDDDDTEASNDDDDDDVIDGNGNSAQERRRLEHARQERQARAPYPALAALEAVGIDLVVGQRIDEWKAEGSPTWGPGRERFFPPFFRWGSDRTRVADLAWSSIGNETERHAALALAVALARLDLDSLDRVFVSTDNIGTGIATIDGVGPVYVATVALIAHLYQQELTPERLAHHAARAFFLDENDDPRHAARVFLDECKGDTAKITDTETLLSRAVVDRLPTRSDDDEGEDVEGVYSRDEALAVILDGTGAAGRKLAGDVRQKSKEQTREQNAARWLPGAEPLRMSNLLALALWRDVVSPLLEVRRTRPLPAAPMVLLRDLTRNPTTLRVGNDGSIHTPQGVSRMQLTPAFGMDAARATIQRGLDVAAFWRMLGHILRLQYEKHLATGDAKAASVLELGTITELAKAMGMYRGSEDNIRAALEAGARLGAEREGEVWNALWSYGGDLRQRGRTNIRLSLGPVLHVDAASFMPKTARLLAPVADPARMPKLTGDHRTFARQHAADQALLCMAAERSNRGVLDDDGFVFPFDKDADRQAIADDTGLYRRSHADLSKKWLDRYVEPAEAHLPEPVGRPVVVELADAKHLRILDPGMRDLLAAQSQRRRAKSKKAKAIGQARIREENRILKP